MNKTAAEMWNGFIGELQACVAGRQGWVDCSKGRAKKLGIAHANLTIAAEAVGLKVERHGRYGYVASRKTV